MASSLNGTGLTFSSGQTLNALPVTSLNGQTGDITNTNLYAIGSYVTGRPATSTAYAVNTTIAGSSLYSTVAGAAYNNGWKSMTSGNLSNGATLINTGTWRCVSPCSNYDDYFGLSAGGAWVRIS